MHLSDKRLLSLDQRVLSPPLPSLPFKVVERIIHYRLALPRSFCPCIPWNGQPDASWDSWAGIRGREVQRRQEAERREVTRIGWELMSVCQAWKSIVLKYLYVSPVVTDNLARLAKAILRGDAKWSDIHSRTFSAPGRYLTTLDLSRIPGSVHPTAVRQATGAILPLLPNVVHLKLGGMASARVVPLDEIGWSPFAKGLQCLEGVWVDEGIHGGRRLVTLLKRLSSLQVLGVVGPPVDVVAEAGDEGLEMPTLHTLKVEGLSNGYLLDTLTKASLPNLTRLLLTPAPLSPFDQTGELQRALGPQIVSLTYLSPRGWPRGHFILPPETLRIHPSLLHLSVCEGDYEAIDVLLRSPVGDSHPLSALTVPRWSPTSRPSTPAASVSHPGQPPTPPLSPPSCQPPLLQTLLSKPPPRLKTLTIDGFKWVKPELGPAAMGTGQSGEMRVWAGLLSRRGIVLRDMEGEMAPRVRLQPLGPIARGRRRSNNGGNNAGWMAKSPPKPSAWASTSSPISDNGDEDGG
ncbi:uncharacterized protein L203_105483 [Cryptococcus depauperatus CBS 7841]|uniref:Uncharacterized protein n=1 Tax=Cryptococcus depauperatus CBS 7841 TaxID=1295531 RepID=A0A1E3ID23_9TREE|nr:hypothetical protein L203_04161 [Cryptococcus depauperatus CBS 7841]